MEGSAAHASDRKMEPPSLPLTKWKNLVGLFPLTKWRGLGGFHGVLEFQSFQTAAGLIED